MRLYSGQIPEVAADIVQALEGEDLEITPENIQEVDKDIQSVLKEYLRLDRELSDQARDRATGRGSVGREKRKLAKMKGVSIFEDPVGYIIDQLIETFFHSHFVEEVFSADRDLRRKIAPVLKGYMNVQEELDLEVRDKIKNLEEGSASWDIEYQKVMGNLKRVKKLEE